MSFVQILLSRGILEGSGAGMSVVADGQPAIGGQLTLVQQQFMRGIHIGMDGSVLEAGSKVYAPWEALGGKLWKIWYWHGIIRGKPVCAVECLDNHSRINKESDILLSSDFFARELFNAKRGFVASKIRRMQSLVRARRARRIQHVLTEKMLKLILCIVYKTIGN